MASTLRAGQRKLRNDDDRNKGAISAREGRDIEDMSSPRTPVIYKVVSKSGEEEMDRPAVSLWWSGVAAGLSISCSLLAQTVLEMGLPETRWIGCWPRSAMPSALWSWSSPASSFLPKIRSRRCFPCWPHLHRAIFGDFADSGSFVLLADMAGALVAALFFSFTPVLDADMQQAMLKISGHILNHGWLAMAGSRASPRDF